MTDRPELLSDRACPSTHEYWEMHVDALADLEDDIPGHYDIHSIDCYTPWDCEC